MEDRDDRAAIQSFKKLEPVHQMIAKLQKEQEHLKENSKLIPRFFIMNNGLFHISHNCFAS